MVFKVKDGKNFRVKVNIHVIEFNSRGVEFYEQLQVFELHTGAKLINPPDTDIYEIERCGGVDVEFSDGNCLQFRVRKDSSAAFTTKTLWVACVVGEVKFAEIAYSEHIIDENFVGEHKFHFYGKRK